MRTGGNLFHTTAVSKMTTAAATATTKATFSPPATIQRSPWHSPVPYLFGGLAAMLGLIAFALLILACSYWKLSGGDNDGRRDVEGGGDGEKGENSSDAKSVPVFEENFLVIMAGEVNPTFLATPISMKGCNSSIDDNNDAKSNEEEGKPKQKDETEHANGEGAAEAESRVHQEQSRQ